MNAAGEYVSGAAQSAKEAVVGKARLIVNQQYFAIVLHPHPPCSVPRLSGAFHRAELEMPQHILQLHTPQVAPC